VQGTSKQQRLYVTIVLVFGKSGNTEVVALSAAVTFLLWFLSSLATLPLSVHSRHAKCWTSAAFSICATSSTGDHGQPLTSVDVVNTPAPPPLIQVTVHRFRRWHFPLPVSTHVDSRATRFPLRLPVCSHRVGIPIFGIKSANFDARQRCFFALPVTTGVDSGATIFTSRAGL